MSERFLQSDPSIYDSEAKSPKRHSPPFTIGEAPDIFHEEILKTKVWFAPICPRDKLGENLNKIEEISGILFQILVQGNQVQIIYFIREDNE